MYFPGKHAREVTHGGQSSRFSHRRSLSAFGSGMLAACLLVGSSAVAAEQIGAATRIVSDVFGNTLNRTMAPGEALYSGQKVRTGLYGAADLTFDDGSILVMGPRSEVTLDTFAFDPVANIVRGNIQASRGLMRFASGSAKLDLVVKAGAAILDVRGTSFDFLVKSTSTEIVVREGSVEVMSKEGSRTLEKDQVLRVSDRSGVHRQSAASKEMEIELNQTFKLLGTTSKQHLVEWLAKRRQDEGGVKESDPGSVASVAPRQVPALTPAPSTNQQDLLLYMDLEKGRVVIELKPVLAPKHVARIKELVRQGFYDGLIFHNVVPGQVAVTGDPLGTGRGGTGQTQVNERSSDPFIRGAVGMMPVYGDSGKTDSQIFIATRHQSHLEAPIPPRWRLHADWAGREGAGADRCPQRWSAAAKSKSDHPPARRN